MVKVELKESIDTNLVLELDLSWYNTLMVNDWMLRNDGSGSAPIITFNTSLCTQVLKKGTYLGKAAKVNLSVDKMTDDSCCERTDYLCKMNPQILSTESTERIQWRKQELQKQISL